MPEDALGQALTTSSEEAAARYREGVDALLAQQPAFAALRSAVSADPEFAVGHAALAFAEIAQGDPRRARPHFEQAVQRSFHASARERSHVEALLAGLGRDPDGIVRIESHLDAYPGDLLVLAHGWGVLFFGSRPDRKPRSLAIADRVARTHGDHWYVKWARAFALHELGRLDEAEREARRSITANPSNANAAHSLAHVAHTRGEYAAGLAELDAWLPSYAPEAPLHGHLSWHGALLALTNGDPEAALARYAGGVSPAVSDQQATIWDATSLLWRLELDGHRDLPWPLVADYAERVVAEPGPVLKDVHAALAFAAARPSSLDSLLGRWKKRVGEDPAASVVVTLLEGLSAFTSNDPHAAADRLAAFVQDAERVGGSDAQREVYEDSWIAALDRAGRVDEARARILERLARRPSPRDELTLERLGAATTRVAVPA
jgi:tetratricopeptide (TPR) repeat protein